jgi:hypothetical protein
MLPHRMQDIDAFITAMYTPRGGPVPSLTIIPYQYPIAPIVALAAAGGVNTQQLVMQANSDFLCFEILTRANIAHAAETVSTETLFQGTVLITDSGSNQQWTNAAVDVENYCSTGFRKNPLPYPKLTEGRSALTVVTTNTSAASAFNITMSFSGVLIFVNRK